MSVEEVAAHIAYRVRNAALCLWPFPHAVIDEVLPAAVYDRLAANLPMDYVLSLPPESRQSVAYPDRASILLTNGHLDRFPDGCREPWRTFIDALQHPLVLDAYVARFEPLFSERYGGGDVALQSLPHFVWDRGGYALPPHTDSITKVITGLYYFPADARAPHLGTTIYVPRNSAFTCEGRHHHKREDFVKVITAPYVPNTLFLFFKNERSFHGVEPVAGDHERHIVLHNIIRPQ